jgi:hypothetical protein
MAWVSILAIHGVHTPQDVLYVSEQSFWSLATEGKNIKVEKTNAHFGEKFYILSTI